MARPSHPRPATLPGRLSPREPRKLVPLDDTTAPGPTPALPSAPRTFSNAEWLLSTHLFPAALPRTTPDVPPVALPAWTPDKQKWRAAIQKVADDMAGMRYRQWDGELKEPGARRPLWVCVNRYRRRDASEQEVREGVTLLFAHANGFNKETWEPTLLRLLQLHRNTRSSYRIAEVWVWEAVNHGDSFLVNEDNLSGMYDWQDNCRDVIQFLLRYLPSLPSSSALPTHLARLPDSVAHERRSRGLAGRRLVGVGHSLGGGTLLRATIEEQALLETLIVVDPIVRPYPANGPLINAPTRKLVVGAIQRQTRWASRQEAKERFVASPFFAAWDPEVLDAYAQHGLTDDPDRAGGVKLKMPGVHEALTFTEVMTTFDTWDLLDTLDKRVELRWIMPGKHPEHDAGVRERLVWRRPVNSSNVVIPEAGHLIAQEAPTQLAEEINEFLQRKYGSAPSRL